MPRRISPYIGSASRRGGGNIVASGMIVFVAAITGVAAGVVASLAVITPMVRSESATQGRPLDQKIAAAASFNNPSDVCVGSVAEPIAAPHVLGASASMPPSGQGGGAVPPSSPSGSSQAFVTKLIQGALQKSQATIENTGPNSVNKVVELNTSTTTVTNTNDISVSNANTQTAVSGSASVTQNTSGGSATSGDASNTNSTDLKINITNK